MVEYNLIGHSLDEAVEILNKEQVKYRVLTTQGFKDKEILNEPYVVRCNEENNEVILIVSKFMTEIR